MTINIVKGSATKQAQKTPQSPGYTYIPKVIKGDTYMVLAETLREYDDEFSSLYFSADGDSKVILEPPIDPKYMLSLPLKNNTLSQCIEVLEVNIDGTGHDIVAADGSDAPNEVESKKAKEFFDQPFPGLGMIAMRRKMREELESLGWAFLEVVRSVDRSLFGIRNLPAKHVRYVRLGDPMELKKTINRNGKEVEAKILDRPRKFATRVGTTILYYKEYGVSLDLDKVTGVWADEGVSLPPDRRASEVIPFKIKEDVQTPYGYPRWINQLPSVLGSRKAEEQNLEFLDAGGIPPAIIFVEGGVLSTEVSAQLKAYLGGQNKSRNRAVVVEAQSSSGSLDSSGSVRVKVERFGSERINDGMYAQYDKASEDHVRMAFRLPPIFLGKSTDYNFATAMTAYMVAEAQVFLPERVEFDAIMTNLMHKELGVKQVKFKSNSLTIKNIESQMKAFELAMPVIDKDDMVKELNELVGLSMQFKEPPPPPTEVAPPLAPPTPKPFGGNPPTPRTEPEFTRKKLASEELNSLVKSWAIRCELEEGMLTEVEKAEIDAQVDSLSDAQAEMFYSMVAARAFGTPTMREVIQSCGH